MRIRAELAEISHNRVICEMTAHDGDRLIARGEQIQVVMDKQRVKQMIEEA